MSNSNALSSAADNPRSAAFPSAARQGAAGAAELRQAVRTALIGLFGAFLKKLPAALLAEQRSEEQHQLGRALVQSARLWLETYIRQVDAHLIGSASYQAGEKDDTVESVSHIELHAEMRCAEQVQALHRRFSYLRDHLFVPLHAGALAPAGLYRALQETAEAMGWPASQRQLLFQQFDLIVTDELERFYRNLLAVLARVQVSNQAAPEPGATPPEWVGQPLAPPRERKAHGVDDDTKRMLRERIGSGAIADEYTDSALAADLLVLAEQPPGAESPAPVQRMTLAGQFLNQAVADPLVPRELRPAHETMRFPLVKSALADATLFTTALHPMASLVNEMMLKAATARVTGDAEVKLMAQRLQELLVQFDLSPDFVRNAMNRAEPIPETQIQWFFELQKQQAELRRETVIAHARQRVLRELERSTFGRDVPPGGLRFLNSAWGPLLVKRLVEHGAGHFSWNSGIAVMDQLLDLIEAREPQAPPSDAWNRTIELMAKELGAAGLPSQALSAAFGALEEARRSAVTPQL